MSDKIKILNRDRHAVVTIDMESGHVDVADAEAMNEGARAFWECVGVLRSSGTVGDVHLCSGDATFGKNGDIIVVPGDGVPDPGGRGGDVILYIDDDGSPQQISRAEVKQEREDDDELRHAVVEQTFSFLARHTRALLASPATDHAQSLEALHNFAAWSTRLAELSRHDNIQPSLLREIIERAEGGDQCSLCHQLLDKPENDYGDGELLGHTLDCPGATARELLEKFEARTRPRRDHLTMEEIRKFLSAQPLSSIALSWDGSHFRAQCDNSDPAVNGGTAVSLTLADAVAVCLKEQS